jgi:biopolymer transport protein ExbB/TolQ
MFISFATLPLLGSIRATLDQPVFPGKVLVWLLFMLSIIGWVMIISKSLQLAKMKRVDRLFTDRLRKSKTTLEVFEEGWEDEVSLKHLIYLAGAREAAFQLLGSREPQEMMQRRIKQAGKLGARQLEFLRMAFQTGYRAAVGRLQSGIEGFRLLAAASILIGTFGLVWTLMTGFDQATEFAKIAPTVGGALGYFALAILVASPAVLARIGFQAIARRRKQELERFRDDINRLFERSFAGAEAPLRSGEPDSDRETMDPTGDSGKSSPPGDGKKRYHSIRDRLLRPDAEEEEEEDPFIVNPIARQAASIKGY